MPIAPKPKPQVWQVKRDKQDSWSSYGKNDFNYHTTAWRKPRNAFMKANPLCVYCESKGLVVLANICDHIIPVQECKRLGIDPMDETNWQPLCKACDDVKRAKEVNDRRR